LKVSPGEIAVLPQGFRFSVNLLDSPSRGYVAEIFGTHFELPDLGPIGIFCLLLLWNLNYYICYWKFKVYNINSEICWHLRC